MIEIVTDKDRNLKNVKQIGTPREENKIYIENSAYNKIRERSYKEKRVFVLMGHTERMEGKYATFVEAVIPVKEIDFIGNTPRWNNSTWGEVFQEIKRNFDDMIIVGWAVDIKGMPPKPNPDLERVHREHFGGVHQLLFLLDSLEQEEVFYIYKENKLISKDGFYIYHQARRYEKEQTPEFRVLVPEQVSSLDANKVIGRVPVRIRENYENEYKRHETVNIEIEEPVTKSRGRYRQMLQEDNLPPKKDGGNIGLALAIAMLIFVIGVGVYENREEISDEEQNVEVNVIQEAEDEELSTETIIPVEVVPGTEEK